MLNRDGDSVAPPPATLSEAPERLTEFAFALSDPSRTALLTLLVQAPAPRTADELATEVALSTEEAREHLKILVSAGLAATARTGVTRRRTYRPTVADLEVRFFMGERPKRERERTAKLLQRDARRRERQKRRLERKEKRLAKEKQRG